MENGSSDATRSRCVLVKRLPLTVTSAVAAIIATVFAVRAIPLGINTQSIQAAAGQATSVAAVDTSRSGASIAHDVAEVLRLSGITCDAQYNGDGAVTVGGHLGDPKSLEAILKSRAIRDIVGLKRVLAVNLGPPGGTTYGTTVEGTRIVSVVVGADPEVVTAATSTATLFATPVAAR